MKLNRVHDQVALAKRAWCEHGWSFWLFHFWAFCLTLVGYAQGIAAIPFPQISFTAAFCLELVIAAMGFCSLQGSSLFFFLWCAGGLSGFFLKVEMLKEVLPFLALLRCLGCLFPYPLQKDRLKQRLFFKLSLKGWLVFRMALGVVLALLCMLDVPDNFSLALVIKAALATLFILGGWLRLTYLDHWQTLEKGVIFLTVVFIALSWQSAGALSVASLLALVAGWDLRVWPARRLETPHQEIIFFDGTCSLCQGAVSLVLVEDLRSTPFFFALQSSDLFEKTLKAHDLVQRKDALYVLTAANELLEGEKGVGYILKSLGGFWVLLGLFLDRLPVFFVHVGYRWIAKARHFQRCPRHSFIWPQSLLYRLKGAGNLPFSQD